MTAPSFAHMSPRYTVMWETMRVLDNREHGIEAVARLIKKNQARYETVCHQLGIDASWWIMLGAIHYRESTCNFGTHLYNGDPLEHRTVHVPAGRPLYGDPPFTWEYSAQCALRDHGARGLKGPWSPVPAAYVCENYNGWGYQARGETSAYLWAGTNKHATGKFIRDHVYSTVAIDPQEGVMPVMRALRGPQDAVVTSPATQLPLQELNAPVSFPEAPRPSLAAYVPWYKRIRWPWTR